MRTPRAASERYVRGADALAAEKGEVVALADAQFVIAREHGFDSWPKFAKHIETLTITRDVEALTDPVAAFFEAAGPPRAGHSSGTLERAEAIRARHPEIARSSIYAAAMIADEVVVRDFLARNSALAAAKGGPSGGTRYPVLSRRVSRCPQVGRIRPHGPGTPRCWERIHTGPSGTRTIDTPPRDNH